MSPSRDEMLWPTLKAFAALRRPVPDHPLYADVDLILAPEEEDDEPST